MTDTKHTPTPWSITGEWPAVVTIRARGCGIAEVLPQGAVITPANAAHIVRCVNAHDELVAALRAIVKITDGSQPKDYPGALMVARAALAKAGS